MPIEYFTEAYHKDLYGTRGYIEYPVKPASHVSGTSHFQVTSTAEAIGVERKTSLMFSDETVNVTDYAASGGHGSYVLYTFPAGLTKIEGANVNLSIVGSAEFAVDAAVKAALGTHDVVHNDETMETTEINVIGIVNATLANNVGTFSGVTTTAPGLLDGRTTPVVLYLNFAVPAVGITGNGTITFSGTVNFAWVVA